ncbi:MAG: glycosyltransferase family 87 protein [Candidatus Kapaibacterium sp.]
MSGLLKSRLFYFLYVLILNAVFSYGFIDTGKIKMDFASFYYGAHVFNEGGNIYDHSQLSALAPADIHVYPYIYTPLLAWILSPFSGIPPLTLQAVWTYLQLIFAALSFVFLSYIIREKGIKIKGIPLEYIIALLLIGALPFRYVTLIGQIDPLMVLFISIGIYGLHTKNSILTGIMFGLAGMIKVTPALLLIYLIAFRHYKAAMWAVITAIIIFLISLAAGLGNYWAEFFNYTLSIKLDKPIEGLASVTNHNNFSVTGFYSRLIGPGDELLKPFAYGTLALVYGVIIYYSRSKVNIIEKLAYMLPFAAAVFITPPIVWRQHMLYLMPGAFFFLYLILIDRNTIRKVFFVGISIICMLATQYPFPKFFRMINDNLNNIILLESMNLYSLLFLIIIFFIYLKDHSLKK